MGTSHTRSPCCMARIDTSHQNASGIEPRNGSTRSTALRRNSTNDELGSAVVTPNSRRTARPSVATSWVAASRLKANTDANRTTLPSVNPSTAMATANGDWNVLIWSAIDKKGAAVGLWPKSISSAVDRALPAPVAAKTVRADTAASPSAR